MTVLGTLKSVDMLQLPGLAAISFNKNAFVGYNSGKGPYQANALLH